MTCHICVCGLILNFKGFPIGGIEKPQLDRNKMVIEGHKLYITIVQSSQNTETYMHAY